MKTNVRSIILISVLWLFTVCPSAQAHNLWLNPSNYYPEVGSTVDIGIGWGHKYPAGRVDQEVTEDRVEAISAVDPDGLAVNLEKVSAALYRFKVEKAGAYLITAKTKSGFFTTTPEGRKFENKQSVANPIKCTNYHLEAKTVILAGGQDKNLSHALKQPLEVMPLTNPHKLKKGEKLTVKVLFEGKPLSNAAVKATYAGFETEDIAPHGSPQKEQKDSKSDRHFPVETHTDEQGQAVIQLDTAGYWMILLSHKPPFEDKTVCDEHMYNTAFTFEVRLQP